MDCKHWALKETNGHENVILLLTLVTFCPFYPLL